MPIMTPNARDGRKTHFRFGYGVPVSFSPASYHPADAKRPFHPLRRPRADANDRLQPCGERGRYAVSRLMEKYGNARLTDLRHTLANCEIAWNVVPWGAFVGLNRSPPF
jgi:hypothetical protein